MKRLTKKQLNEQVQVTCYRETETMRREDAIDFYREAAQCCEGCEAERYWNIYSMLIDGEMHAYDEIPQMHEHCPYCDKDVEIDALFEVQMCPNCLRPILPCSLCDHDKTECSKCPLEKQKAELEAFLISAGYRL